MLFSRNTGYMFVNYINNTDIYNMDSEYILNFSNAILTAYIFLSDRFNLHDSTNFFPATVVLRYIFLSFTWW